VLGQTLSLISTVSLEPEPIPPDVKVVLLGERLLYYTLSQLDPDFAELFKVAADFEEQMDRNLENHLLWSAKTSSLRLWTMSFLPARIARNGKLRCGRIP
jgi:predicted ATP-dependent protease